MFNAFRARSQKFKMDILFFNSIKRAKDSYIKKIGWHAAKALLLSVFLVIDSTVLKSKEQQLKAFMVFGTVVSIINLIINVVIVATGYSNNSTNNQFFLNLAQVATHLSTEQRLTNQTDTNHLQNCVSTNLYNANTHINNNDPGLTEQIRDNYEKVLSNLIQSEVYQKYKFLPCIDLLGRLLSLAAVIYGIIALCMGSPNIYEILVIVLFLILESFNIWVIIFIVLILVFCPFICCFGCIYLAIKGTSGFVDRNSLRIPQSTYATAKIIEQSEGTCSICLQNFSLNDKVKTLSCSPKHVFHQNCIMSWLRVSNSCPMCRTPLPELL